MSDTPETDALWDAQTISDAPYRDAWQEMTDHASKLEREHNKVKENAERYRLDANRLEAEVMILKEKLKEYDDTLTVCTDNFSCKTFVPQKWELPPYQ